MNNSIYNDSEIGVTTLAASRIEKYASNVSVHFTSIPENSILYERTTANFYDEANNTELFRNNTEDVTKTCANTILTPEAQNRCVSVFSDYPQELLYFGAICFVVFAIVGAVGNFSAVLALSMCKRLRNATTAFIVNLCVADFLFCVFSMPLSAATFIHKDWRYGEALCIVYPLVRYSNGAVSLFSIIAITVNRYILIGHPRAYELIYTKGKIFIMICLMWLFSPLFLLPPFLELWGKLGYDPKVGTCTILAVNGKSPKTFLFITAFVVPSIVFVVCYLKIYFVVKKGSKKTRRREDTLSSHSISFSRRRGIINKTYEHSVMKSSCVTRRSKKELKVLQVMLVIFILFIICYFPGMFVKIFHKEYDLPVLNVFAYLAIYFSNIINPVIYIIMSDAYKKAYKELFCRSSVNNVSQHSVSSTMLRAV